MHILADLGAGADGDPGINHGALVHIGAKIDEGRHKNGTWCDVSGMAHDAIGHGAKTARPEVLGGPALKLGGHLVPPL